MNQKIVAVGILLTILLAGCATPTDGGGNGQTDFELGKAFTIKENGRYVDSRDSPLLIEDVRFSNSRCPDGVMCVWAGEVGVNFKFLVFGTPQSENIYLGETIKRKANALGYGIELISIDFEKKEAQLRVSKVAQPAGEKAWFSYDPKQCGTNPWSQMPFACDSLDCEEFKIKSWLAKNGITVYDYASKQVSDIVCMACSCPRGDRVAALVESKDSAKMQALGWTLVGNENGIACTMDARICPDGSAAGRTEPFCEFRACPTVTDVNGAQILIIKTDHPGFVMNPVTTITTIENDGTVKIETIGNRSGGQEGGAVTYSKITRAQVEEIAKLALSTNFFSLTPADSQMCIADMPTKELEITIGSRHNNVSGIGTECNRSKLAASYEIIGKIEADLQTPDPKTVLFEKNASWGPCPEPWACSDNYALYYSGEVMHNGSAYNISSSEVQAVLGAIRRYKLNSQDCFVEPGTDYFVTYKINVDGDNFSSTGWLGSACADGYSEIERIIVKETVDTDPNYPI